MKKSWAIFLIICACGAVLSVYSYNRIQKFQREINIARLKLDVERQVSVIRQQIYNDMLSLTTLNAFYQSSQFVDRNEFSQFSKKLIEHNPSIRALEWVPEVSPDKREFYEALARKDGFDDFTFKQFENEKPVIRDEAELYYPVFYIEPLKTNEHALGYDLGSNPVRLETIRQSRDFKKRLASPPLNLVQDTTDNPNGLLVFEPIVKDSEFLGFALGVFDIDEMIKTTIYEQGEIYDFSVVDITEAEPVVLRYADENSTDSVKSFSYEIYVVNRKWKFSFIPYPGQFASSFNEGFLESSSIMIVSILIGTMFVMSFNKNQDIRQQVDLKTRELHELNEKLSESNKNLNEFARVASHDLKAPLRKITSFISILEEELPDTLNDEQKKYVEIIVRESKRMNNLIQRLLEYSRVGHKELEISRIDCNRLMRDVQAGLDVDINKSKAVIETEFLPAVDGDELLLHQLFANLVSNAIKYKKPDTPPHIQISAQDNNLLNQVIFQVKDNGTGFDSEYAQRLFTPFSRLVTQSEVEGTGLGLTIVKRIAEKHGGSVSVTSVPNEGTTFYVQLPLRQSEED